MTAAPVDAAMAAFAKSGGGIERRALYATDIRKANHGALKIPLFRCVIVSVPASIGTSGLRSNQVVVQTFRGLHHAEDSDRSGRILCDAGRCRRCRSASQGAAASGGCSGWQVSGRQGSDWQISTSTARRDQGLTVSDALLVSFPPPGGERGFMHQYARACTHRGLLLRRYASHRRR
jgi:hypothetical protein